MGFTQTPHPALGACETYGFAREKLRFSNLTADFGRITPEPPNTEGDRRAVTRAAALGRSYEQIAGFVEKRYSNAVRISCWLAVCECRGIRNSKWGAVAREGRVLARVVEVRTL